LFLGLIWTALFILSWTYLPVLVRALWHWFCCLFAGLMAIGMTLYAGGDIAEKSFFSSDYMISEMIEESMELIGTLFISLSAYAALRR